MIITNTFIVHYAPFKAKPSRPVVSGPAVRAPPGQTVNFTCKSHGFSPRSITLKWFKDGNEFQASQTTVNPEGDSASYNLSSTAKVLLVQGDVRSQVICQVNHVTLQGGALRGTANLSETIRGRRPSLPAPVHTWLPPSRPAPPPALCSRPGIA